jgi:eukaryotic-like serine/threonine-protein kinase
LSSPKVGPYEVVREVARGGMGVVFEVRHPNVPRPLALKLILKMDSARIVQRFQREAQILAQCDRHPNVLKVHHLGSDQGRPYLVTDFVEGDPLSRKIPLAPRSAATVLRKVADALAHVHAKNVLHRDVKPDNILLRGDAPDDPVLIDFGLAWVADA